MVVPTTRPHDLLFELKEIAETIKDEQDKKRFGGEENDKFVNYIQVLIDQLRTVLDKMIDKLDAEIITSSPWSLLCGLVPMVYKGVPKKAEIAYIKNQLSEARDKARNISRLRRQNYSVAALAFHGLFLKSDEEEGIAVSWDTSGVTGDKYAVAASGCTREILQERADRLYKLSILVMSLLGFSFWSKDKDKDLKVGCEAEGNMKAVEITNLFRLTLEQFFAFPKAETLDKVIETANDNIKTLEEYMNLPLSKKTAKISMEEKRLEEKIRIWTSSIEKFSTDLTESQKPAGIVAQYQDIAKVLSMLKNPENYLAEPQEPTNILSESQKPLNSLSKSQKPENNLAESQKPAHNGIDTSEPDPVLLEMALWHTGLTVTGTTRAFSCTSLTYSNLSTNLPLALNLRILDKPKNINTKLTSVGSFATAYMAELDKPIIESMESFRSDGSKKSTAWNIGKVAVKVVRPVKGPPVKREYSVENATCARIVREMRVWSDMKHENILPLLGVGIGVCVDGRPIGYPVAISPWMDEGHLYDYLKAHSDTSHRMRITYMRDIADALTYMHNRKPTVIHGDLKSNNILMREGKVYLCDFGLSRMLDGVSGQTSDVHSNARWAAPELLTFRNGPFTRPTSETDMYSFGSVFVEVLTGELPYGEGLSDGSVQLNRRNNSLPVRPDFLAEDSPYWQFMKKCWRMEPLIRPTARQALAAMEAFLRDLKVV